MTMNNKECVLIVEKDPVYSQLLENRLLAIPNADYEIIHAATLAEAITAIERARPDILILELNLDDSQGIETLDEIMVLQPNFPIVILSTTSDEEMAVEALRRGVQDYLIKTDFKGPHLAKTLRYAKERYAIHLKLRDEQFEDDLTGLLNRKGFYGYANRQLKMAERQKKSLVLIMAAIDDLRGINQRFGHPAGDQIIKKAAQILSDTFRETDLVARLGADEFVILAYDTNVEKVRTGIKRLHERLEAYNQTSEVPLAINFGLVDTQEAGQTYFAERLVERAGRELYQRKKKRHYDGTLAGPKKKILVVDDDPNLTELLAIRLEAHGYEAMICHNGKETLRRLDQVDPDLIIMDVKMPEMDGWTLVKEMSKKEGYKERPIIVLTATEEMRDLFAVEGIKDFLVKPFRAEELMKLIDKHINTNGERENG